jgi:hypothetical protein
MRPENRDALLDAIAKAGDRSCGRRRQPDQCEVFKEFEPWERYALMPTKSAFSGATRQGHRLWCAGASLAIVNQCREGSGQLGDVRAPANAGRNLILEIGLHWPGHDYSKKPTTAKASG